MGVIDVYFVGNVVKVSCWRDVTNYVLTLCPSICSLVPVSIRLLSFVDFFLIGCATTLPMGVAPKAIAESFGYRLKKIDKPGPYSFSHHLSTLFAFCSGFLPSLYRKPSSRRRGELVLLDRYFLIPCIFFFLRIFSLDTLIPLYYLYCKNPEVHFGPCCFRGPLVHAYK
jgi:hypothetical protein